MSWPWRRPSSAGRCALPMTRAWKLGQTATAEPQLSPWEQLSQVLLLTNEFMFVD